MNFSVNLFAYFYTIIIFHILIGKSKTFPNKWLNIYGISQNPDTKEYIMVLDYVKGGDLNYWMNKHFNDLNWYNKLEILQEIIDGLEEIHQKKMVHRDFHTGNILLKTSHLKNTLLFCDTIHISDMGLCGEVSSINQNNIYGVMPYVAPEVLKGKLYTLAADIYSFGMVMYFVATGKQPFVNQAHDNCLALSICSGIRPEINVPEAPKCYIALMKKCWDPNPNNRPKAIEIVKSIRLFVDSYRYDAYGVYGEHIKKNIKEQFKEAEEYKRSRTSFDEITTHPQAIYTSRLLNPFTKNLQKYDNIDNNSVEITDFTE
jgi:serine/threonine protein kinase